MTILKPIFVPVKISWDTFGVDVGVLACPICDFEYTHQGGVEVFNRECEDIPCDGVMVDARGELSRPQGDNPSERRNGIRIYFQCEGCHSETALCFAQHKGNTFIYWEDVYREAPSQVRKRRMPKTELLERGWTSGQINKYLGEPDVVKPNPRFRNSAPMLLYDLDRIEAVEDEMTPSELDKIHARHQRRQSRAELIDESNGYCKAIVKGGKQCGKLADGLHLQSAPNRKDWPMCASHRKIIERPDAPVDSEEESANGYYNAHHQLDFDASGAPIGCICGDADCAEY